MNNKTIIRTVMKGHKDTSGSMLPRHDVIKIVKNALLLKDKEIGGATENARSN